MAIILCALGRRIVKILRTTGHTSATAPPVANRKTIRWNSEVTPLDEFAFFALPGKTPACPKIVPKTVVTTVPKAVPHASANDCDDFCLTFKMAFTARLNSFTDIRTAKTNGEISDAIVKLEGAKECMINGAAKPPSNEVGMQFVCYWPEASGPAAETRFRDLIARVQGLLPSDWTTRQENESYENTGAPITKWYALEPGGKHDVRIYVSGDAVGLHITTWN